MVLRAAKGRQLSDDSTAPLLALKESLSEVDGLLKSNAEEAAEEVPEDIKAIGTELMRRELFSSINTQGV